MSERDYQWLSPGMKNVHINGRPVRKHGSSHVQTLRPVPVRMNLDDLPPLRRGRGRRIPTVVVVVVPPLATSSNGGGTEENERGRKEGKVSRGLVKHRYRGESSEIIR